MEETNWHVQLTCRSPLALLTTADSKTGSYTRSVYVAANNGGGGGDDTGSITLIEGLKFHLYIGVPVTLDVHQLYEEMMLSYCNACCGRRAHDKLRKDVADRRAELVKLKHHQCDARKIAHKELEKSVREAKLVTMVNQSRLHYQYKRLLRGHTDSDDSDDDEDSSGDDMAVDNKPSEEKLAWIKEQMRSTPHFFVIKQWRRYDIAANARLRGKKLRHHQTYRFTFDNHAVLQHFLREFSARPLVIGGTYDATEQKRVGGTAYDIVLLADDSADPSLYEAAKGDHQHAQYVARQCQAFTRDDYVYRWHWPDAATTTIKHGCLEPAVTDIGRNVTLGASDDIVPRLNQSAVPTVLDRDTPSKTSYRAAHATVTFSLRDLPSTTLIRLVNLRDKLSTLSLLSVVDSDARQKKRDAADAGLPADASGGARAKKTALVSASAKPKLALTTGQRKKLQQGSLLFS